MAVISGKWNSVVTFCKIDFFNNGNGNQIIFDDLNEQFAFFDNHKITSLQFEQSSYVRTNAGTLRFAINADKLKAMPFEHVRVFCRKERMRVACQ